MNDNNADPPLLDLAQPEVARLLERGRTRGYVTYDALNAVLPTGSLTTDDIIIMMEQLLDMGIAVVESEDG